MFFATQLKAQSHLDSLFNTLENTDSERQKIPVLSELGQILMVSNVDSAELFLHQGLQLSNHVLLTQSDSNNNQILKDKAQILSELGYANYLNYEYEKAIEFLTQSLEIKNNIKDNKDLHLYSYHLGLCYYFLGDYYSSIAYFEKGLEQVSEIQDPSYLSSTYYSLAKNYYKIGLNQKAKVFYQSAIKIAEKNNLILLENYSRNGIAEVLIKTKELDKSQSQLNQALQLAELDSTIRTYDSYAILGRLKTLQNKLDSAHFYLVLSEQLAIKQNDTKSLMQSYNYFSLLYLKQNKISEATIYVNQMLDAAKASNNFEREIEAYRILADIYERSNDYKNAFAFQKQYYAKKSKLGIYETRTQLLKTEFKYKAEQRALKDSLKFQSYNMLRHNQVSSKEKELKQKETVLTVMFVCLIVVLIAIVGFFRSLRIKKKDNETITLQKEATEMQQVLLAEQNKKLKTKASLYKILRNCSLDKSINVVLKLVLEELVKSDILGGVEKGVMVSQDEDKPKLVSRINLQDKEVEKLLNLDFNECVCGRRFSDKKIEFCEASTNEPEHFNIPVISKNNLLAVIIIYTKIDTKELKTILDYLDTISTLVGDTIYRHKISDKLRMANIENTIKKKEIQHVNKEINWALENKEAINNLMRSIIKNENIGENVYKYASNIFNGMLIKRLNITLFDFDNNQVDFYFLRQNGHETLNKKGFPLSDFSPETIEQLKRNQKVVVNSLIDKKDKSKSDLMMIEEDIKAFASFPLMMDKVLLGSLNISFEDELLLNEREDEAMAMLIEGVTIAIHQNLLFNELSLANKSLTELNNEINSSINYAQKIQKSILPDKDYVKSIFPNSFFYLKQKDVVGGDTFWVRSYEDDIKIVAAIDCTGHGIPGAFMTMLSRVILREATSVLNLRDPAEILNYLDNAVKSILKQNSFESMQDGMDMSIAVVDEKRNVITFSQAHRPICIKFKDKSEIELIKGEPFSIGGYSEDEKAFNSLSFNYDEIELFYMFSDGVVDQFGGENNKKMGTKQFVNTLQMLTKMPIDSQKEELHKTIQNWRGENQQIDDILVIGIKVN